MYILINTYVYIYRYIIRDREIWCSTVARKFRWPRVKCNLDQSVAQQTAATTGHTPVPNAFLTPVQTWATHLTGATKLTRLPAREQTGLFSTSHLVLPVPPANLGVSLITPEMTSNTHTALLTHKQYSILCKSMCSKTHILPPLVNTVWTASPLLTCLNTAPPREENSL